MSSSDRTIGWPRVALLLGLFWALAAVVAGCNFRPLYAEKTESGVVTYDALSTVRIVQLSDRTGQQLHNLLRDRFNPNGQPSQPRYRLEITLRESERQLALRSDETATRADLSMIADYELFLPGSTQVMLRGTTRSVNSYNILESQYATQVSEQNARERGLRELADEIRAQIAIFLTRQNEE